MGRLLSRLLATPARVTGLLVAALVLFVLIPFAGSYGGFDPWETHYGEVARRILASGDYISLWWGGSPIDHPGRGEFWTKPALTFWLQALSLRLFGFEGAAPRPDELVTSFRAEWALRFPSIVLALLAIAALFVLVARLAGRRAAALAALLLATSPSWLLVARQAMTDMAFVAPMTVALCLAALALLGDDVELARWRWGRLSWPHAPAFYAFVALFCATTLSQLLVDSLQLRVRMGGHQLPGIVVMLPYWGCFLLGLFFAARTRRRAQLYLLTAWLLCALASLAKGPAGLALPGLVLAVYLFLSRRLRDLLRLELIGGALVFIAAGFPWWHAMLARHGMAFWNEFIGDNYLNRATGRNGDRGTFEYFLEWVGNGMFPWSGAVAVGTVAAFFRGTSPRQALRRFALVWVAVELTILTAVNTKFHHYLLPTLPAFAILGALFVDDLLSAPAPWQPAALLLLALPVTVGAGLDLAAFPAKLHFLFDYDYVVAPIVGRAWPDPATYGDRYTYGPLLRGITAAAGLALLLLALWVARRRPVEEGPSEPPSRRLALGVGLGWLLLFVVAILAGPTTKGPAPVFSAHLFWLPASFMLLALLVLSRRVRLGAVLPLAAVALAMSAFVADRYVPDLGPHWSQKHVIAAYYAHRAGPQDPLIVWNMHWRGENFYTRNEIWAGHDAQDHWSWVDNRSVNIDDWMKRHAGAHVFFLLEPSKLEAVRQILPAGHRDLRTIDRSNNKLLLVDTHL